MKTPNRYIQMAFAIFAGIVTGSLISLRSEWSLTGLLSGIASGVAVAWILCGPIKLARGIAQGTAKAFRETLPGFCESQCHFSDGYAKKLRNMILCVGVAALVLLVWEWTSVSLGLDKGIRRDLWGTVQGSLIAPAAYFVCLLLLAIFEAMMSDRKGGSVVSMYHRFFEFCKEKYFSKLRGAFSDDALELAWLLLFVFSPLVAIAAPLLVCRYAFIAISLLWKTGSYAFRFVHSEIHVQASTYTAVGVALMWYAHASVPVILVGGSVGALIGVALYRFVSVRFVEAVSVES